MSDKLRVAFIDQVGDTAGGAQESLALLLEFLPPSIDPRVVLLSDGDYADRLRSLGLSVTVSTVGSAIASSTRERPNLLGTISVPIAAAKIAALLRSMDVKIVHTNSVKAHVIGGLAAKLARRPSVAHLRDILESPGRDILRAMLISCSKRRIAISGAVAHDYNLKRTLVVPNPVDTDKYAHLPVRVDARRSLGLPLDVPIVAIVGRINRWKRQDLFIRACSEIAGDSNAHFAIVGEPRFRDADFLPELHALVKACGLTSRFSFVKWVDDPRIVYAAIDIHVNCSTREPFGRTTIEAAAARVPTVCFADSGVAEFMGSHSGCTAVAAGDVEAISKACRSLLADTFTLERAKDKAEIWSRTFDARKHAKRVASILHSTYKGST